MEHSVRRLVAIGGEVDTGRPDQLADDDALGAVDDEGPGGSHHREVAEEHLLFLDLARLAVHEASGHEERTRIVRVALLCFFDRHCRLFEPMIGEFQSQRAGEILNRGDLLEDLLEPAL